MITGTIKLSETEKQVVENISLYYHKVLGCYRNLTPKQLEKFEYQYIAEEFENKADIRLYKAIHNSIINQDFCMINLNVLNPVFTFRLKDVKIIDNKFIFNNIVFDLFPTEFNICNNDQFTNPVIIANIKFKLYKDKLTYSFDTEDDLIVVENDNDEVDNENNYWNYELEEYFDHIILSEPVQLEVDPLVPGYKCRKNAKIIL